MKFPGADGPIDYSTQAPGKTLITFDVDGTLIKAVGAHANKFHKDAFAHAFKIVHGLHTNIDVIAHHGSTDQLVIESVLKHHGLEHGRHLGQVARVLRRDLEYAYDAARRLRRHRAGAPPGREGTPLAARGEGRRHRRARHRQPGVRNAWIKMKALGIEGSFTKPGVGGFGATTRIAARWCESRGRGARRSSGATSRTAVHVGDTQRAVSAAEFGGAKAIAVTTGVFDAASLLNAAGDNKANVTVMDGLTDVDAVLRACGLEP